MCTMECITETCERCARIFWPKEVGRLCLLMLRYLKSREEMICCEKLRGITVCPLYVGRGMILLPFTCTLVNDSSQQSKLNTVQ